MTNNVRQIVRNKRLVVTMMLMLMLALSAVAVRADTPMPTLYIPVTDVITSANNWTPQLAPIISIGIGASIAISVLLFLGAMLLYVISGAMSKLGFMKGGK